MCRFKRQNIKQSSCIHFACPLVQIPLMTLPEIVTLKRRGINVSWQTLMMKMEKHHACYSGDGLGTGWLQTPPVAHARLPLNPFVVRPYGF